MVKTEEMIIIARRLNKCLRTATHQCDSDTIRCYTGILYVPPQSVLVRNLLEYTHYVRFCGREMPIFDIRETECLSQDHICSYMS